tara:strand:+ start:1540 stop:1785 length:246 start_codon:yes stop_codon:yes gene_type:complete
MINHLSHYGSFIYTVPVEFTKKELKELHDNIKICKSKSEIAVERKLRKNSWELQDRKSSIKRLAFLKILLEKIERLQKEKK